VRAVDRFHVVVIRTDTGATSSEQRQGDPRALVRERGDVPLDRSIEIESTSAEEARPTDDVPALHPGWPHRMITM
jgi:hypothetical protein